MSRLERMLRASAEVLVLSVLKIILPYVTSSLSDIALKVDLFTYLQYSYIYL